MISKKGWERIIIVAIGLIAVLLYFGLGLDRYLDLEYIKASRGRFAALYIEHRLAVVGGYMLIYIAVTALSLPGAVFMTLAGGALFGLTVGTVVVSFASTVGATIACGVSRFLLRDWVQNRFGDKLATFNRGFEQEGNFYLFSLRLVPIFPFFVINLVMGLTRMPLLSYYWVSQLGMLPATVVYVNAGKELATIDSLDSILSPGLLGSFILLGLLPITAKKLLARLRRGRVGTPPG